ncbi:4378_t:CDS:1, partial [Gigaspora rosea]
MHQIITTILILFSIDHPPFHSQLKPTLYIFEDLSWSLELPPR